MRRNRIAFVLLFIIASNLALGANVDFASGSVQRQSYTWTCADDIETATWSTSGIQGSYGTKDPMEAWIYSATYPDEDYEGEWAYAAFRYYFTTSKRMDCVDLQIGITKLNYHLANLIPLCGGPRIHVQARIQTTGGVGLWTWVPQSENYYAGVGLVEKIVNIESTTWQKSENFKLDPGQYVLRIEFAAFTEGQWGDSNWVDGDDYCSSIGQNAAHLIIDSVQLNLRQGLNVSVTPSTQTLSIAGKATVSIDLASYYVAPKGFYMQVWNDLPGTYSPEFYCSAADRAGSSRVQTIADGGYGECLIDVGGSISFVYSVCFSNAASGSTYHIYVKISTYDSPNVVYSRTVLVNTQAEQPDHPTVAVVNLYHEQHIDTYADSTDVTVRVYARSGSSISYVTVYWSGTGLWYYATRDTANPDYWYRTFTCSSGVPPVTYWFQAYARDVQGRWSSTPGFCIYVHKEPIKVVNLYHEQHIDTYADSIPVTVRVYARSASPINYVTVYWSGTGLWYYATRDASNPDYWYRTFTCPSGAPPMTYWFQAYAKDVSGLSSSSLGFCIYVHKESIKVVNLYHEQHIDTYADSTDVTVRVYARSGSSISYVKVYWSGTGTWEYATRDASNPDYWYRTFTCPSGAPPVTYWFQAYAEDVDGLSSSSLGFCIYVHKEPIKVVSLYHEQHIDTYADSIPVTVRVYARSASPIDYVTVYWSGTGLWYYAKQDASNPDYWEITFECFSGDPAVIYWFQAYAEDVDGLSSSSLGFCIYVHKV